jgi:Fe2+ transport system protein FeoA
MQLNNLKKGEHGKIIRIDAEKALRDRLSSFGIVRGERITVIEHSLAKQTIEVEIGTTLVVLRANEAEKINIEKEDEKQ